MKTIIINASPRKNWNTARLLQEAMHGAKSIGEEIEYINLYDIPFTGCHSCLVCKRKDVDEPCKCYWKDELSPILERVYQADRLILGSPIYFSEPTGQLRSFIERIAFPALSYNDYSSNFARKIDVDVILTMNVGEEFYKKAYEKRFKEYFNPMHFLNGEIRIFPALDTLQINDYFKYNMAGFSAEHKMEVHKKVFPSDMARAYQIGAKKL
jgi:multimeric flavodoxin WrbA